MDREVNEPGTIRVRHRVQTQPIVELNASLSSFQKERIKSTPFKFLVDLVDNIIISSPILVELISKWDVVHKAFRIRENLVPFTVEDVRFSLGLATHLLCQLIYLFLAGEPPKHRLRERVGLAFG